MNRPKPHSPTIRAVIYAVLTLIFIVGLVVVSVFWEELGDVVGGLPKDPDQAAKRILDIAPVIVGSVVFLRRASDPDYIARNVVGWTHW